MIILIPLTAKLQDGIVLNTPTVVFIKEDSLFIPKERKVKGQSYVEVHEIGSIYTFEVYESLFQIETLKNISTPNIFFKQEIDIGLSAAGTTQADGLKLTKYINEITLSQGTSEAVVLKTARVDNVLVVINNSSSQLKIFPALGGKIDMAAINAVYNLGKGKRVNFVCDVVGEWIVANDVQS